MSVGMLYFLGAGATLFTILVVLAVVYSRRLRKVQEATWEELLGRLIIVDRHGVERIAKDSADMEGQYREGARARELKADEVWQLVGGLRGLEALVHNSRVLVDIAAYLQSWHPEAQAAADELRQSAREIEWHVERLQQGERNGNVDGWFAAYARESVATYYRMTRRILSLCQDGNGRLFNDLQRSI